MRVPFTTTPTSLKWADPEAQKIADEASTFAQEILFPVRQSSSSSGGGSIHLHHHHDWGWWWWPSPVQHIHHHYPSSSCSSSREEQEKKDNRTFLLIGIGATVVAGVGSVVFGREWGTKEDTEAALDRLHERKMRVVVADRQLDRITDLHRNILERRLDFSRFNLGCKGVWLASGLIGVAGAWCTSWAVCQGALAIFGLSSVAILAVMGYRATSHTEEREAEEILTLTA